MAHEIEKNNAFFVSTPAWHGLGTVLKNAPTVQQAWELAYPHSLIECALDAVAIDSEGNRHTTPIQTHKAIFRDDGKHIGTVGADYNLEQPVEVLQFFEPFLESGMVELEAGGSLREGSRMWALGKLKNSETEIAKGDSVNAYLLAATSFDGSLAKIVKFCGTRVVCANTLAIAREEKGSLEFKIKHTKNMGFRTTQAQNAIANCLEAHKTSVEAYRVLAQKQVTRPQMITFVQNVIAPQVEPKKYSSQMQTKVNLVIDLLDTQRGLELVPAIKGSAWQAYNAVSEYITHHASRSDDTRVSNQWFDANTQELNQRALEMAISL